MSHAGGGLERNDALEALKRLYGLKMIRMRHLVIAGLLVAPPA